MITLMPITPQKACPVIIRERQGHFEVLAFQHPLAGKQLVKGTIEAGETAEQAARRELYEESGIEAPPEAYLGTLQVGPPLQEWHFVTFQASALSESWIHRTADGGGLEFVFFWHPLHDAPVGDWHLIFRQALAYLRERFGQDRE